MVSFKGNWLNWDNNGDTITGKATSIQIKSNGKKYVTLEDTTVTPAVDGVPDVVYLNVNPMQEQQLVIGERFKFEVFNDKLWFNVEPAVHPDWDVHEDALGDVVGGPWGEREPQTPARESESETFSSMVTREPFPRIQVENEEIRLLIEYYTGKYEEARRDMERYGRLIRLLEALQ